MEQKTVEEFVEKEGKAITQAITGKEPQIAADPNAEPPLEEARRLNRETKELMTKLESERQVFENKLANAQIAGRAYAGTEVRPKTQADVDRERADDVLKRFLGRK